MNQAKQTTLAYHFKTSSIPVQSHFQMIILSIFFQGVFLVNSNDVVFASFNQDTTSLAVGTPSGYKLYSLTSTDSLDPIYENSKSVLAIDH